jgi:AcrR family transcriptional regulator
MAAVPKSRVRMSPDARRDQLLETGAQLLAERRLDAVQISEIADRAGVSRGLLYHYFPTKNDFVLAVTQAVCGKMFEQAEPSPDLPVEEQLQQVLRAYVAFAEEHEHAYRAMHTNLIADPRVRELRAQDLARHERRVFAAFGVADPPELLRTAVRGWLAFVIAAVLDWLSHRAITRDQLIELCAANLRHLISYTGTPAA